jgi:tetraacyldisaccharide 4'-kinase
MKDHHYWEDITMGKRRGIDALFFRLIASCCSLMYIVGVQLRLLFYRWGLLRKQVLQARVISIGNITLGGAGKTPVAGYLASRLREKGHRVGILSRGYKRESKGVNIITNGHTPCLDWSQAGDEPYLLARRLSGVPVVVGKNRANAGQKAIDTFGTDALLLDDGFQHLQLHRDIDILVIDASNPFGNNRVFPAGTLREPKGNVKRADLLWLTRVDQAVDPSDLIHTLRKIHPEAGLVESIYHPLGLRNHASGSTVDLSILKGSRVVPFCGIANPLSFEKTITDLGAEVVQRFTFPDHHPFTVSDIQTIQKRASERAASFTITTEKDGVRIPPEIESPMPIYELIIEVQITRGEDDLEKKLWSKMNTESCHMRN